MYCRLFLDRDVGDHFHGVAWQQKSDERLFIMKMSYPYGRMCIEETNK